MLATNIPLGFSMILLVVALALTIVSDGESKSKIFKPL